MTNSSIERSSFGSIPYHSATSREVFLEALEEVSYDIVFLAVAPIYQKFLDENKSYFRRLLTEDYKPREIGHKIRYCEYQLAEKFSERIGCTLPRTGLHLIEAVLWQRHGESLGSAFQEVSIGHDVFHKSFCLVLRGVLEELDDGSEVSEKLQQIIWNRMSLMQEEISFQLHSVGQCVVTNMVPILNEDLISKSGKTLGFSVALLEVLSNGGSLGTLVDLADTHLNECLTEAGYGENLKWETLYFGLRAALRCPEMHRLFEYNPAQWSTDFSPEILEKEAELSQETRISRLERELEMEKRAAKKYRNMALRK